MKRLFYWLAAVTIVILLILGLRAYFLSRIFYQPDWYRDQQAAGDRWKNPAPGLEQERTTNPAAEPSRDDKRSRETGDSAPAPAVPSTDRTPRHSQQPAAGRTTGQVSRSGGSPAETKTVQSSTPRLTPLQQTLQQKGQARINADELVPTLLVEMSGQDDFDPYTVVRGAKTTIHPGRMIVEMMVNLEEIPRNQLTEEAVRVLDQLRGMLPENALQQVYIKGDLRPVASGSRVVLENASTVSVGRFTFDLEEIKGRFQINPAIEMNHFAFSRFELHEGYLLLER